MFTTVTGAWPRPAGWQGVEGPDDGAVEALVADVVRVQVDAGIDLVSDGQLRWPDLGLAVASGLGEGRRPVDAWRAAAALTDRPVKQALPGPYSLVRRLPRDRGDRGAAGRRTRTLDLADALAAEIRALADAGCPLVEVEEPAAVGIGHDEPERELFVAAQRRLLGDVPPVHASLAITGGSAAAAGAETIFAAPYASYLFDLIAGPDNWYLVRAAPAEVGIVCGALAPDGRDDDRAPLLAWAAHYAASSNGRGLDRVGLANASALAPLSPDAAAATVRSLGRAGGIAGLPLPAAVAAGLDPRAVAPPGVGRGRPG